MQFSNRGPRASGFRLRALSCLVATFAFALVVHAQRGANTATWFEGARLIVGDGNAIQLFGELPAPPCTLTAEDVDNPLITR